MLTRLKVSGFKNLMDVEVRFGPFTCVAGANGVGKSNLFDAILFLSALADRPLLDAARSVRDDQGRTSDVRSIFFHSGDTFAKEMTFEAEMIIPKAGLNDLGQPVTATSTFLHYQLRLGYQEQRAGMVLAPLTILAEHLEHITVGNAAAQLLFPHAKSWRDSVIVNKRFSGPFISTAEENGHRIIRQHQDGGSGRPQPNVAANLPRTVLSAPDSPTLSLARQEMRSWRELQLEPTALRASDSFTIAPKMERNGAGLATTLYHLAHRADQNSAAEGEIEQASIYALISNRLGELIADVREVWVERDERAEVFTLKLRDRHDTVHSARALSDGTLRFLALAVMEMNPDQRGTLCFEEPENGIHPARIPAMLRLLGDLAVNPTMPASDENPLRQVIVNTHAPAVVQQIHDEDLLVADTIIGRGTSGQGFDKVRFAALNDTWRVKVGGSAAIPRGDLLAYLGKSAVDELDESLPPSIGEAQRRRRVVDHPDMVQLRLLEEAVERQVS